MDDLSPLMAKSSSEVMSSHVQKLMQVSVVGRLYLFFSFALFLLREVLCRLWGSLCFHWEVLGLGKEGGYVRAFDQLFIH